MLRWRPIVVVVGRRSRRGRAILLDAPPGPVRGRRRRLARAAADPPPSPSGVRPQRTRERRKSATSLAAPGDLSSLAARRRAGRSQAADGGSNATTHAHALDPRRLRAGACRARDGRRLPRWRRRVGRKLSRHPRAVDARRRHHRRSVHHADVAARLRDAGPRAAGVGRRDARLRSRPWLRRPFTVPGSRGVRGRTSPRTCASSGRGSTPTPRSGHAGAGARAAADQPGRAASPPRHLPVRAAAAAAHRHGEEEALDFARVPPAPNRGSSPATPTATSGSSLRGAWGLG